MHLHRLALSELARVMHGDGWLVIGSEMDTQTRGPADRFRALIETEFAIHAIEASYRFRWERWFFPGRCSYLMVVAQKKRFGL